MALRLIPLTQRAAIAAVAEWHRHNTPPRGDVIRVGVEVDGVLVAVGMAGRPVARHLADGTTLEVTRIASTGARNACSMLYGALARAAFALGYTRVITYTRADEPGASLRAVGWRLVAERAARKGWDAPSRPRTAEYDSIGRVLWETTSPTRINDKDVPE